MICDTQGMEIFQSVFPEVIEVHPTIHEDRRGRLAETYHQDLLEEMTGRSLPWKQGNTSVSAARTIRGLHYSLAPGGQDKYVTCLHGMVWDVAVDIREESPTFGQYAAFVLSGETLNSVYIPTGFAHGFLAMKEGSVVSYLLSSTHNPGAEYGIHPLDPRLDLSWGGVVDPILSDRDKKAHTLKEMQSQGMLPRYRTTDHDKR
jgi:dTDP-4-dehydrorhamnose 3,5-epimerase